MFGRGIKYRIPPNLMPEVQRLTEFKDPVAQAHVRLKDGREYVVRIWYPDRLWAILGITYMPFAGTEIESIYQTEEDKHGGPRGAEFMFLDEWAIAQVFSLSRWRLKLREILRWMRGERGPDGR